MDLKGAMLLGQVFEGPGVPRICPTRHHESVMVKKKHKPNLLCSDLTPLAHVSHDIVSNNKALISITVSLVYCMCPHDVSAP